MLAVSLGSLLFILTLALAILSTAQAFDLFSRPPRPAPTPVVEPIAAEVSQLPSLVVLGEQKAFGGRDDFHGRELWLVDGMPAGGAQHDPYELAVGGQPICCVAGEENGR